MTKFNRKSLRSLIIGMLIVLMSIMSQACSDDKPIGETAVNESINTLFQNDPAAPVCSGIVC